MMQLRTGEQKKKKCANERATCTSKSTEQAFIRSLEEDAPLSFCTAGSPYTGLENAPPAWVRASALWEAPPNAVGIDGHLVVRETMSATVLEVSQHNTSQTSTCINVTPATQPNRVASVSGHVSHDLNGTQVLQGGTVKPTTSGKARKDLALKCMHADCNHHGTFPRQYELDRHMRVKHDSFAKHACPIRGCFKGPAKSVFARSEKLTSHLRAVHTQNVPASCPASGCFVNSLDLELLGVHVNQAHSDERSQNDQTLRAVANASSTKFCKCPLWNCAKHIRLEDFMQHIMSHSREELSTVEDELRQRSYHLTFTKSTHLAPATAAQTCDCPAVSIAIACPMCACFFRDHGALRTHLECEHIIASGHAAHYKAWVGRVDKVRSRARHDLQERSCFKQWPFHNFNRGHCRGLVTIRCPFCGTTETCGSAEFFKHHLDMLVEHAALKPHRLQILRLYPDFAKHPTVWGDLKRKQLHASVGRA